MRARLMFAAAVILLMAEILVPALAVAQGYPSRQVKVIVGFPAGSSLDLVSRIVTEDIGARTGAVFVIDNRPGALGAIGLEAVAKSAADGYTIMPSSSATHSSGPHLLRALQKLQPVTGLSHIAQLARFDIAVITNSAGPYQNAQALIEAARGKPETVSYGYGSGTGQVGGAAFSQAAGIKAQPIPYRGQPAAITDLLGGRIDFVVSDLGATMAFLQQGSLRAVALMADRRSPLMPDIPTAAEVKLPSVQLTGWIGFDAPPGLPPDITQWWVDQIKMTLANPSVREKFNKVGMEPTPRFGDEFATFVTSEYERWGKAVGEARIEPE